MMVAKRYGLVAAIKRVSCPMAAKPYDPIATTKRVAQL